jgi:AbiV family abortive infection protein
MRARAIKDLVQLGEADFFDSVAQGLALVMKNAGRLNDAAAVLDEAGHYHGSHVLNTIAEEEAAKFLILVDAVRCPRLPADRFAAQLARFNDHIAKGLYARSCMMRPGTLQQLQEYIDLVRDEFYLDGLTGVEWIFRNEIQQAREAALYVDYVSTGEGHHWADPAQFEDVMGGGLREPLALRMARSLFAVGLSSGAALKLVAQTWQSSTVESGTRWTEIRARNHRTLEALESAQLLEEQPEETYFWVTDQWQFPMYDLDLRLIPVRLETLRERQGNWSPDW